MHIYLHTDTCPHMHALSHVYTHTCVCTLCTHTYMHAHTHMCTYTHTQIHALICMHSHMPAHMHTHVLCSIETVHIETGISLSPAGRALEAGTCSEDHAAVFKRWLPLQAMSSEADAALAWGPSRALMLNRLRGCAQQQTPDLCTRGLPRDQSRDDDTAARACGWRSHLPGGAE